MNLPAKTTPQVFKQTGIGIGTLQKYATEFGLPKIGPSYVWTEEDIKRAKARYTSSKRASTIEARMLEIAEKLGASTLEIKYNNGKFTIVYDGRSSTGHTVGMALIKALQSKRGR